MSNIIKVIYMAANYDLHIKASNPQLLADKMMIGLSFKVYALGSVFIDSLYFKSICDREVWSRGRGNAFRVFFMSPCTFWLRIFLSFM